MQQKKECGNLLTPDQLALRLGIARKTVIVWAREGRVPSIRVGRFVRFDPAEIDRWLERQRR
jgi:excisionase family DNA binding protein